MFFILSKVLVFLLSPFYWIILLFIWMRLAKSKSLKKKIFIVTLCIFVFFSNAFVYRTIVSYWQPVKVNLQPNRTYTAGILLGGMSDYNKKGQGFFGDNADRFIQTANLYHQGIIQKIIVSGGTAAILQNEPAEALFLRKEFLANNIPDSNIIVESRSRNTYENAVYSKVLLDSMHTQPPYILITSSLHMKRSVAVFSKSRLPIIPFPCDYKVIEKDFDWDDFLIPKIFVLYNWPYFIKEVVGLYVYKLTGKA